MQLVHAMQKRNRDEDWATYKKNRAEFLLESELKKLKSLDKETITNKHLEELAEASTHAIEQGLPGIQELYLGLCDNITGSGIRNLIPNTKNLLSITISSCNIGDKTACAIATCCPLLEKAFLVGFKQLTSIGITALAKRCKNLKKLNVADCFNVDDNALFSLAAHSKLLEEINLFANQKITVSGIKALLTGCKNLKKVFIYRCRKITPSEIEELKGIYPGIIVSTLHG